MQSVNSPLSIFIEKALRHVFCVARLLYGVCVYTRLRCAR